MLRLYVVHIFQFYAKKCEQPIAGNRTHLQFTRTLLVGFFHVSLTSTNMVRVDSSRREMCIEC